MGMRSGTRGPPLRSLLVPAALLLLSAHAAAYVLDLAALPHRTVCTSQLTGLDTCGINGTVDDFSGYELELFKRVANILASQGMTEWAPGNWSFLCLDKYPPFEELALLCHVIANGATVNTYSLQDALYPKYSFSTYQSGRRIIIFRDSNSHMWTFLDPFQAGMWLLMFGSTLLVALVVMALEVPWQSKDSSTTGQLLRSRNPAITPCSLWTRYSSIQWSVVGLMLQAVHNLSPVTSGGRVVVLGTAFSALLLACMYTSAYTAHITVSNLKSQVSSMNDLTSLPVGIFEGDEGAFKQFALQDVKLLPWMTYQDERNMLQMLRSGDIAALVIDAAFADYQTSVNCDLYAVGEMVLPINMGFQFAGSVPDSYILNFDHALQWMQSQGEMTQLANKYIRIQGNCPNKQSGNMAQTQIKLGDVAGLWIFLAGCICVGALWHLGVWLFIRFRPVKQQLPVVADPDTNSRSSVGAQCLASMDNAVTLDERIHALNERMSKVKQQMDAVPMIFAATMDKQLSELCSEVATVLMKSSQFKEARSRGQDHLQFAAESNPPGTPGSIEEHLALITSKFNKMQDLQQK